MKHEITRAEVTEAAITFAMNMAFLIPYLYWMIKFKPRKVPRDRALALIYTASLLSGAGLIFASLFAIGRNGLSLEFLTYPLFVTWKGTTLLCVDIVEVLWEPIRALLYCTDASQLI